MAALCSARLRHGAKSPLVWILAVGLALRAVGLTWGLPASDSWDNDGIAPRDFWPGLIETFTPGRYFTYPPAHLALLALATAPITAVILARAPTLTATGVLAEALKVPYMTSYSVIARGLSVVMSLGIVYAIAKIAEEIAGRRAGECAAAVCVGMATLTYYSHTSNLDVPYLFWATLAILALVRCVSRGELRRLRSVAALAALAIATKDQAYALFLLGGPLALSLAFATGALTRAQLRAGVKEAAIAAVIGATILLAVDGAIVNPSGFIARARFLAGPATGPFAYYSADGMGRTLALLDTIRLFDQHYPLAFAPLVIVGLARAATLPSRSARAAGLVPVCAAASFTLLFNCVARRTEQRFLLPQMTLWAAYAGIGVDALLEIPSRVGRSPHTGTGRRRIVAAGCAAAFAWALFRCADMDANLILDPRYEAEGWLRQNVAPGDLLEVHGKSVYLLRAPPQAHVVRVGPEPVDGRNPVYGAEERQDALGNLAARTPRWIVVSAAYAGRYLTEAHQRQAATGRVDPATEVKASADDDATRFFRSLLAERLGYRIAHVSTWTSKLWPRVDIHGSVAPEIWIFERT